MGLEQLANGSTVGSGEARPGDKTHSANMAQEEHQRFSSSVILDRDVSGINCPLCCISFRSAFGIVEGKDLVWLPLYVLCLA